MNRAKLRKLVNALPPGLPDAYLEQALEKVTNPTARQQVRARYQRRRIAR